MNFYDWEAIERDYRAGHLSIRHLATKHAVPESTVRSRAKSEGWQRDLTREVRAATRAKLSRTSRRDSAHEDDAAIVEQASNEVTDIINQHRRAIARWRSIAERLADSLAVMQIDESNHDKFARSLNSGIDALSKTVKLERQAFNMGDDAAEENLKTFEELMADVAPHD